MRAVRLNSVRAACAAVAAVTLGAALLPQADGHAAQPRVALPNPIALDALSWSQFITAVTPSGVSGKVTYETWASDQNIYVSNPCAPGSSGPGCNVPSWPSAGDQSKMLHPSLLGAAHMGLAKTAGKIAVQVIGPDQPCQTPPGLSGVAANSGFPSTGCVGEEVRRDRATFNYLVQNGLWSQAGLTAFYNGPKTVALPTGALEVKADWIPVAQLATWINQTPAFITSHFYTSTAQLTKNGPPQAVALTSMHVSVKQPSFPDWVWANFENAYTPGRCDQTGCQDLFGAATKIVPAKTPAWQQYGACPKSAQLSGMMSRARVAPIFANYCLTGTQTRYTANGRPTLLGSPIIEPLNANVPMAKSSCISCHAGASFNASGPNGVGTPVGPNKPPSGYKSYDFMWGLLFAN